MLFSSLPFIFVFLPAVLFLYYIVQDKIRNYILLTASLAFYAWGEPQYCILMILLVIVNYFAALLLDRYRKYGKSILSGTLLIDFGALCYFKYADFLICNFNHLFRSDMDLLHVALPIGISFYIFQSVSYVIDVYRKETVPQGDFFKLLLFISFFPQMIAGPILKYHDLEPQLDSRSISISQFAYGVKRFFIGLAKKILIADILSVVADRLLDNNGIYFPCWCTWIGVAAYSFQIFYDFSGYSDMAIGLAQMFGFRIPENFNYPYIAESINNFWRRWHISLSTWFKEYVYIPLGGNRVSTNRNLFNLLVVFILTGIWHGAAWNFVLWGMWHGLFIILERLTQFHQKKFGIVGSVFRHIYTIGVFFFGWILFREKNLSDVWNIIRRMFGSLNNYEVLYCGAQCCTLIETLVLAVAIICSMPIFRNLIRFPEEQAVDKKGSVLQRYVWPVVLNAWLMFLFLLSVMRIVEGSQSPFIYFRF